MPAEPLLYDVDGAAKRLGIGRTCTYSLISSGELRSLKVGRRRLVPAAALEEFVAARIAEAAS